MSVSVVCDDCGKEHRIADDSAGKKFRCRGCQSVLTVPSPKKASPKAVASPKKPAPKERVDEPDYEDYDDADDDDDFRPLPRKSSRRPAKKSRKGKSNFQKSVGSTLNWFGDLDYVVKETYIALALVVFAAFGALAGGSFALPIVLLGALLGISLILISEIWVWLEIFHLNKPLWFLGFVIGWIPALNVVWVVLCVCLYFDELRRPLRQFVNGVILLVCMAFIGFHMLARYVEANPVPVIPKASLERSPGTQLLVTATSGYPSAGAA